MSQQETKDMAKHFYRASAADFMKIPGSPISYWASDNLLAAFAQGNPLHTTATPRAGMITGNNAVFMRLFHEVDRSKFNSSSLSREDAESSQMKWFPYQKGGPFRKYFGNMEFVINWENDGHGLRTTKDGKGKVPAHAFNEKYIFRPNVNWSALTSGNFSARMTLQGALFDASGSAAFPENNADIYAVAAFLNSPVARMMIGAINPTLNFQAWEIGSLPILQQSIEASSSEISEKTETLRTLAKSDWDAYETSWDFTSLPLLHPDHCAETLDHTYTKLRAHWQNITDKMQRLEEENNRIFIDAYGLQNELTPKVSLEEVTLTCNPAYRYGGKVSVADREIRLRADTVAEFLSYAVGCMFGRYALDKPGLILANQGETLQDYLDQIPSPSFAPDENAILPLTDQEWFPDDATNRFREFIRTARGEEHLQGNLDFVAESLCLHAIKAKRGESALDIIRRYLSTQFYKDHLRTYKKRPIYWLFSSGKHKAFECLVYLHRYNESTLARMRTEYVIPLSAKLNAYADKLEQDIEASTSTAEAKRLEKEVATLHKQQTELAEFDEKLRHYADQRISLDLDDGVKVNYGKFGDLLAEVKAVTGQK